MSSVLVGGWKRTALAVAVALVCVMASLAARGNERAQLFVTNEQGFVRLVLSFPDRLDLPSYRIKMENSVLVVSFDAPIDLPIPDVAATVPDYVGIARVDPDGRGLRFGLRTTLSFNRMEAGEKLFIDLMPPSWQGLPPALPSEVVAELTRRALDATVLAEQKRRAEEARLLNPTAQVRVGRNPTFVRVQFNWNVDAEATFAIEGETGNLDFSWPVPIDVYAIKADLPAELLDVENIVTADGSRVAFHFAPGVVPRYYQTTGREFVVDIDLVAAGNVTAEALVAAEEAPHAAAADTPHAAADDHDQPEVGALTAEAHAATATPYVTAVGSTLRIVFPFEEDTAAAVYRRGDTIWMLFDTLTGITQPDDAEALAPVAREFVVTPAGDTQVVRMELSTDRLATLGSEGRAWVLSLGDMLLVPTEPVTLSRRRDMAGLFQVIADLQRPSRVHEFRDPVVGDLLHIVTAYPPARGVVRTLEFVDFSALPSVHGLVVKPAHDNVEVAIDATSAVISAPEGLTVSALDQPRGFDGGDAVPERDGFVELRQLVQDDPMALAETREALVARAARGEGEERDRARLDLAKLYLANQYGYESIGVLQVLEGELKSEDLTKEIRLISAIAGVVSHRPVDALGILNSPAFIDSVDALMWRAIAKADAYDFEGARADAAAAETVIGGYPAWIRSRFYLAAIRAAIETGDAPLAGRYLKAVEFAKLTMEETNLYLLLSGRVAELDGRRQEALDTYGQVIVADRRPTRAEAVYRTLLLLDESGDIDLAKATGTLAAEALLWRGNPLEADMQKLLAELYFRDEDYRLGFETVRQAAQFYPESASINALVEQAEAVFGNLYLDGEADAMSPVDALSLYYDFRQLTPPGARGDEMIRNLARRLVKVDLLRQAADLLDYQIENRLEGVAQSQIAADLAIIEIADRRPEAALRVLNRTRAADLSPSLDRQRRILEARALIEAGRIELALDLLQSVEGRDADLLRIDAHWQAKRYVEAAELLEVLYVGDDADVMSQPARMHIIKAAVGFVLAGDTLGLSRLRSKFGERMAQSAEWPMFEFVTGEITTQSVEFRQVAREVSGLDSLGAFLTAYRELYGGEDSLAPLNATKPEDQV